MWGLVAVDIFGPTRLLDPHLSKATMVRSHPRSRAEGRKLISWPTDNPMHLRERIPLWRDFWESGGGFQPWHHQPRRYILLPQGRRWSIHMAPCKKLWLHNSVQERERIIEHLVSDHPGEWLPCPVAEDFDFASTFFYIYWVWQYETTYIFGTSRPSIFMWAMTAPPLPPGSDRSPLDRLSDHDLHERHESISDFLRCSL